MATPNYEQIQSFGNVTEQLKQAAIDEFMEYVYDGMTIDELVDAATNVAMKFNNLGCELGAQWYDLCSELAGLDVEAAYLPEVDETAIAERAKSFADRVPPDSFISDAFNYFLQNEIEKSIRITGDANLWRDYERGMAGGKWARVPVGDTCAWCLMLASQGAWYLSEKSALRGHAGKYHDGCNCIAVYHADAESIQGYEALAKYKSMYYEAENTRIANETGRVFYDDELKDRIVKARAVHDAKFEAGETDERWTEYNETMIVMRYKYGLK